MSSALERMYKGMGEPLIGVSNYSTRRNRGMYGTRLSPQNYQRRLEAKAAEEERQRKLKAENAELDEQQHKKWIENTETRRQQQLYGTHNYITPLKKSFTGFFSRKPTPNPSSNNVRPLPQSKPRSMLTSLFSPTKSPNTTLSLYPPKSRTAVNNLYKPVQGAPAAGGRRTRKHRSTKRRSRKNRR